MHVTSQQRRTEQLPCLTRSVRADRELTSSPHSTQRKTDMKSPATPTEDAKMGCHGHPPAGAGAAAHQPTSGKMPEIPHQARDRVVWRRPHGRLGQIVC